MIATLPILLAALAAAPAPRQTPAVSILLLAPDPAGGPRGGGSAPARQVHEVLATMHDLGLIDYPGSPIDPKPFAACLALPADRDRQRGGQSRERCIAERVPAGEGGAPVVVVLVETMRWRSAAEQMVCVGPTGTGRSAIYLKDRFHIYARVRESVRSAARRCIAAAVGPD